MSLPRLLRVQRGPVSLCLRLTRHACARLEERGISVDEVCRVVQEGRVRRTWQGVRFELTLGRLGERLIVIVDRLLAIPTVYFKA